MAFIDDYGLLRLPQVLAVVPVSRSTWLAGVKTGRFPRPMKLGPRVTAWRRKDILELIESNSLLDKYRHKK